jgi:hypothetical protein
VVLELLTDGFGEEAVAPLAFAVADDGDDGPTLVAGVIVVPGVLTKGVVEPIEVMLLPIAPPTPGVGVAPGPVAPEGGLEVGGGVEPEPGLGGVDVPPGVPGDPLPPIWVVPIELVALFPPPTCVVPTELFVVLPVVPLPICSGAVIFPLPAGVLPYVAFSFSLSGPICVVPSEPLTVLRPIWTVPFELLAWLPLPATPELPETPVVPFGLVTPAVGPA